jgi:signal transduction histidine kinase
MRVDRRFNIAGFAGWLACMVPSGVDLYEGRLSGWPAGVWSAAFLTFGATYARYLWRPAAQRWSAIEILLVSAQTGAGLAMVWAAHGMTKYLCGITLVIVAGELPYVCSRRVAWIWVATQCGILTAIFWHSFSWLAAVSGGGAFAASHVFNVGQSFLRQSEQAAREQLGRANAELKIAQELLAENSRVGERLRISRDLHDALGHHLTALSLQLDVASRRVNCRAAEHVREAHAITKLLLSDIRDVVSQLRQTGRIDLSAVLLPLAATSEVPRVHLEMPAPFYLDDPAHANAWTRCVQEILTNATRHAGARHLWIEFGRDRDEITFHARDDGVGAVDWKPGHGLTGMRERIEERGGRVEFNSVPGHGFEVRAHAPAQGGSS